MSDKEGREGAGVRDGFVGCHLSHDRRPPAQRLPAEAGELSDAVVRGIEGSAMCSALTAFPETDLAPRAGNLIRQRRRVAGAPELPHAWSGRIEQARQLGGRRQDALVCVQPREGAPGGRPAWPARIPKRRKRIGRLATRRAGSEESRQDAGQSSHGSRRFGSSSHPNRNVPSSPKRSAGWKRGRYSSSPRPPGRSRALKAQKESRPS